jgi:riboflavin biosynthesis pyrimidine reductase
MGPGPWSLEWNHTRLALQIPAQVIPQLKQEGSGNMMLLGSSDLAATLMKQNHIDEFLLVLTPFVIGSGGSSVQASRPNGPTAPQVRAVESGGVILHYAPKA